MVTHQSVQGHTALTHPFEFFDIRALWKKTAGLDQCGPEHFGRLIFATIRKSVGLKGLTQFTVRRNSVCVAE